MLRYLTRLVDATRYSARGLASAWREEAAFRTELVLTPFVAALAVWLADSGLECALLLSGWGLVLIVELVNSAIEAAVDRMGREPHELAGRAKDMGSAAVFSALMLCALIWVLVLAGKVAR